VNFAVGICRAIVIFSAIALVPLSSAPQARADAPAPGGDNLAVNPKLARPLPPPGWIAEHRRAWVKQHEVYKSTCQNPEVTDEIHFLNRLVGFDGYLLNVTQSYLQTAADENGAAAVQHVNLATSNIGALRKDIKAADDLASHLQALPPCRPAEAPVAIPAAAATHPDPVTPAAPDANPAEPPARKVAAVAPAPGSPQRVAIRFDNHIPALTPTGIRTFDAAIDAIHAGKKLQLAIEGCEDGADYSSGSLCERRLQALTELLAENGVHDPRRLFADFR
jgi:hypothetical protein